MLNKVLTMVLLLFVGVISSLKPGAKHTNSLKLENEESTVQPEVLTIERLEVLLKRASEIFKPKVQRSDAPTAEIQQVSVPIQFLQPPAIQPYNFYLPLFSFDDGDAQISKLDDKSRKMEHFTPPPQPKDGQSQENFYAVKPKKSLPKKFNESVKHINIKWLNAYEKQLSSPSNKESIDIPRDVYLLNDERNRINFEDTFFSVDMKVPDRTNKLEKSPSETQNQYDDDTSQGEEDLIAAAALQIPLITHFTNRRTY